MLYRAEFRYVGELGVGAMGDFIFDPFSHGIDDDGMTGIIKGGINGEIIGGNVEVVLRDCPGHYLKSLEGHCLRSICLSRGQVRAR